MAFIKMRYVDSEDFRKALAACQMAFGCMVLKKRTLVWISCFEKMDDVVIRETLELAGSTYAGRFNPEQL